MDDTPERLGRNRTSSAFVFPSLSPTPCLPFLGSFQPSAHPEDEMKHEKLEMFEELSYSPRSFMLYTPAALELALRWPLIPSLGGEDERPETAESTLVRAAVSVDMMFS